jgi:hypothetical protein
VETDASNAMIMDFVRAVLIHLHIIQKQDHVIVLQANIPKIQIWVVACVVIDVKHVKDLHNINVKHVMMIKIENVLDKRMDMCSVYVILLIM